MDAPAARGLDVSPRADSEAGGEAPVYVLVSEDLGLADCSEFSEPGDAARITPVIDAFMKLKMGM